MRSHVFTDGGLAKHAGRFVWLSVDTEKEINAAFGEKYPIENWPTLLVIDSASEKVAFKWLGSATVPQLARMFDDAEAAVANARQGDAPDALLTRADQLYGEGKPKEAAALYQLALQGAPGDWPHRSRCVESLLTADYGAKNMAACAKDAAALAPSLP